MSLDSTPRRGGTETDRPFLRIAVTGSAASGKSTVCGRLRHLGVTVISADELARQAVEPGSKGLTEIVARFGPQMLAGDGTLDRSRLRRAIVRDPARRRTLEEILHPEIIRLMQRRMKAAREGGRTLVVAEVPLLFESGLQSQFDVVVTVSAPHETLIDRLMARDNVNRQDAEGLLNAQISDQEKVQLSEIVIKNNGSRDHLLEQVDNLHRRLVQKTEKKDKSA